MREKRREKFVYFNLVFMCEFLYIDERKKRKKEICMLIVFMCRFLIILCARGGEMFV